MSYTKEIDLTAIQADVLTTDTSTNGSIKKKNQLKTSSKLINGAVNEVYNSLADIKDTVVVASANAAEAKNSVSAKQDNISDLETIRSGAALGATAIQEHQDISGKQDVIDDLETIRSGAALGATAIQEHQDVSGKADKADTLAGYGITDAYTKTEADNAVADKVAAIVADAPDDFDTLKEVSDWIKSDTSGAAKMQADISALKNDKQDTVSDLETIRSGAALGATAIQSHQDISGKADKATTLAGYGITNAYTKAEVDAKITAITAGTAELTEGTSALASGTFYAQYE